MISFTASNFFSYLRQARKSQHYDTFVFPCIDRVWAFFLSVIFFRRRRLLLLSCRRRFEISSLCHCCFWYELSRSSLRRVSFFPEFSFLLQENRDETELWLWRVSFHCAPCVLIEIWVWKDMYMGDSRTIILRQAYFLFE